MTTLNPLANSQAAIKSPAISQHALILKRLKRGWTTGLQALEAAGTMKLSTRVSEFRRAGHVISDKWVEAGGKRFKAYKWVK